MKSTRPFPETIQSLLEIQQISGRELARRANRHGMTMEHSHVSRLIRGEYPVRRHHLVGFARTLGIQPETFAEYRLLTMRDHYDPDEIGWDRAIRNLELAEGEQGERQRYRPQKHLRSPSGRAGRAGSA